MKLFFYLYTLLLYYIYYLERAECNCVRTWHHNYIKYFTYCIYIVPAIILWYYKKDGTNIIIIPTMIYVILAMIYLYSIYKYINILNNTQCSCAIHNMKYLHNSLYYIFNIPAYIITIIFNLALFSIILAAIIYIMMIIDDGLQKADFYNWLKKPYKP